jgi:hypothetical protein
VVARVERELRVEDAGLDAKLLEEQLEPVRAVDVGDKDEALAPDELELEQDIGEQELVLLGRLDVVLGQVGGGRGRILLEPEDGRVAQHHPLEELDVLGQGRAHQERLVDLGQEAARKDLSDVGRVAVREDEVGLVDRQRLERAEGERLGLEEGERPRRRRDDDVGPVREEDPSGGMQVSA